MPNRSTQRRRNFETREITGEIMAERVPGSSLFRGRNAANARRSLVKNIIAQHRASMPCSSDITSRDISRRPFYVIKKKKVVVTHFCNTFPVKVSEITVRRHLRAIAPFLFLIIKI